MTRTKIPEAVEAVVAASGHGKRVPPTAQLILIDWYEEECNRRGIEWGHCFCGCGGHVLLSVANKLRGAKIPRLRWQPLWFLNGHQTAKEPRTYVLRDTGFTTPCWLMNGYKTRDGYAMMRVKGKGLLAHRHYYEEAIGPIPKELEIDHLCRVRHCVNPEHLEPVTSAINSRRGIGTRLNSELVIEMQRLRKEEGYKLDDLAKRFKVSKSHVSEICSGKAWQNIEQMGA